MQKFSIDLISILEGLGGDTWKGCLQEHHTLVSGESECIDSHCPIKSYLGVLSLARIVAEVSAFADEA